MRHENTRKSRVIFCFLLTLLIDCVKKDENDFFLCWNSKENVMCDLTYNFVTGNKESWIIYKYVTFAKDNFLYSEDMNKQLSRNLKMSGNGGMHC